MSSSTKYSPLSSDDGNTENNLKRRKVTSPPRLLTIALVLSLASSLASLVFLVLNAHAQWQIYLLVGGKSSSSNALSNEMPDPGMLERPSKYIGLDNLPSDVVHSALPNTLDVFPPLFQPVDHVHRKYVFPTDGHARFTFNGRISPGDHRVLLTDHVRFI